MQDFSYHKSAARRAVHGNITVNMYALVVSCMGEGEMVLRGVFELPPTEADHEAMDEIATEIMADFSTMHIHLDYSLVDADNNYQTGLTGVETFVVWERE